MNENGEKSKGNVITSVSVAICALVFVCAVAGLFVLPEKIFVQLMTNSDIPETSTMLFLISGVLIVGLASLMCVLTESSKKWLAIEAVLAVAVVGCEVYNYIVL